MINYLHLNVLTGVVNTYQYISHQLNIISFTSVNLRATISHKIDINDPFIITRSQDLVQGLRPSPLRNVRPRQSRVPVFLRYFKTACLEYLRESATVFWDGRAAGPTVSWNHCL